MSLLSVSLSICLALGCATTGGSARSSRTVTIDGEVVHIDVPAEKLYRSAQQKRDAGDLEGATRDLDALIADYYDSRFADPAKVSLAHIHLDNKEPARAQALLEKLLVDNPQSEVADEARYLLALAQIAQGDASSAAPTLKKLVDNMGSDEEKRAAALKLADELLAQGQAGEAARYLNQAVELTRDPDEKAKLEARLLDVLQGPVGFADVRRLVETEARPGTLLDEVLTYRLARVHLHLRDSVSAAEQVKIYLERYPDGRYAKEAAALQKQLEARVEVAPKSIGVVLPLTGAYKSYGHRVLTALQLGIGAKPSLEAYSSKTGGAGVIKGKNGIQLVVRDSAGDPNRAAKVVEELVEKDHVIAVIGDILLDTSLPVSLEAEQLGVPVISLSRREGLATLGPWSFRMYFTAEKQARSLAALAMDKLGHKRFAVLYPKHSYGLELMNAFWDEVEKRNGEVTAIEAYEHDQTTFTNEAKALVGRYDLEARYEFIQCRNKARELDDPYRRKKALESCRDEVSPIVDFDAILLPDDYRTVSYIVPALVAEDILVSKNKYIVQAYKKTVEGRIKPVQLLGGSMWNDPELGNRLNTQIDGALFVDGFAPRSKAPAVERFVDAFAGIHHSAPGHMEAQAYDAASLASAILTRGDAPTTRAGFRDAVAGAKDFPGVTGLIRFDENGDSDTPATYFTFDRGNLEVAEEAQLKGEGSG